MTQEQVNYQDSFVNELTLKVRDLEEKQRILKDRLLLIGQNLVELKEQFLAEHLETKKEIESLKQITERMKSLVTSFSEELPKFARKEDLEILQKQAKLFQPLDFVRKKDLKELMH